MKIDINELRKVKGIGSKTLERIMEQFDESEYISEYNPELHLNTNTINNGDCLDLMNGIPDNSIDMILADLPYGTTSCSWDSIIPLDKIWKQYKRIIKDDGAIVLHSSQPFTTELIQSNLDWFKYDWVWYKNQTTGFALAKRQPMKNHESVCVFYKNQCIYNYIKEPRQMTDESKKRMNYEFSTECGTNELQNGIKKVKYVPEDKDLAYPKTVKYFKSLSNNSKKKIHPTQKPIKLAEYMIKTYTDENDIVLDNVSGSGTTAVACINTNRNYICIEKDKEYYDKSVNRIKNL